MSVAFEVLGPLSVERDGSIVSTLSSKPRTLLAILLVRANSVVSVDALVDGLWGDDPPATATAVIQTYISQLRKALEPAPDAGSTWQVVERVEPGYRLRVASEAVDADRFERLLADGQAALRAERVVAAATRLRSALAMWRGPALADVTDAEVVRAEALRLDELRLVATESRIEADLRLGRHAELAGELETLVAEHGLRERLWAQLMLSLYRSGRQAEALAAAQRLRGRLKSELGLDPGPELDRLEHDILVHAPGLAASTPERERASGRGPAAPASNLPRWTQPEIFVGRLAELDQLATWWRSDPPVPLALVAGESGIGKTRLATTFARSVEASGHPVLFGRALELGGSEYEPVLGALRQLARGATDEGIGALDATSAAALALLVPELVERRPDVAGVASSWGTFDLSTVLAAIARCVVEATSATPLVVLDDVQWAEPAAVQLLTHLLSDELDVRVLATCRHPGGLSGSPFAELLANLRRDGRPARRVTLAGLDEEEVATAVATMTGADLSDAGHAFARALRRRTNGHPLYVREYVLHVDASRDRAWPTEEELDALAPPEGVAELVGQRLSRLGPASGEVLRAAAVLGEEFDLEILAALARRPVDDVLTTAEQAVSAGLLYEEEHRVDRYGFHHVLVADVLLGQLTASRRARLEWRAGEALAQGGAPGASGEIARHLWRGVAVGDPALAATWCRRAGDEALAGLAFEDAMDFYEWALVAAERSTADDPTSRADLLIALSQAADRAGDRARCRSASVDAAGVARAAGDAPRFARAAISLLGSLGPGNDPEVVALMTESVDWLRRSTLPSDRALLAQVLARLSGYRTLTDPVESGRLAAEALRTARLTGDGRTLCLALVRSTQTLALDRSELFRRLLDAVRLAERAADLELRLAAHGALMVATLVWGERSEFDQALDDFATVAATTPAPTPQVLVRIDRAGVAALDGRYSEAQAQLDEARRATERLDDPFAVDKINMTQLLVDRELGGITRNLSNYRGVGGGPPPLHRADAGPWLHVYMAYILGLSGELEQALPELEQAMANLDGLLAGFPRRRNLAMLTEAANALCQAAPASVLAERFAPELRYGPCVVVGSICYLGAVARYQGLLAQTTGDLDGAVAHHQRALATHERMRAAGWAARSHYDLALALMARAEGGDVRRAGDLLARGRAAGRALGMTELLSEIDAAVVLEAKP